MKTKSSGQMTLEAVLIITLLLAGAIYVVNYMERTRLLARLVEEPWGYLSGMIENGVWLPPEDGLSFHPNHLARHGSPQGDLP